MSNNKPRTYTQEFRESATKLVFESGRPISHIAKDLGISSSTLGEWVRKNHCKNDADFEEIKRLRKEIRLLRQERDILKKAAAYLSQSNLKDTL